MEASVSPENSNPVSKFSVARDQLQEQVRPRLTEGSTEDLYVVEIVSRLTQLDVIVSLVDKTMDEMIEEIKTSSLAHADTMIKANLFAEAFYIFAFRVFDITRFLNNILGVRSLIEDPRGVVIIRNAFIIHPEKKTRHPILSHNLLFSSFDRNVYIQAVRPSSENDDLRDQGFRENLAEFIIFIETWIAAAVAQLAK